MELERNPEIFVMVVGKMGEAGAYLATRGSAETALEYIRGLSADGGKDPRVVKKVFSVNQVGGTHFYEVVFEGVLKLKALPTNFPERPVTIPPLEPMTPPVTPPVITSDVLNKHMHKNAYVEGRDPLGDDF